MRLFQQKFIEYILKDHFFSATPTRKLLFRLRFDPDFHPDDEIEGRSNEQIYQMVKEQLPKNVSVPTGTDLKFIVRTLASIFEDQMKKDEVDVEFFKSEQRGRDGKWLKVYDWLWQKYFPRWSLEQHWQEFVAMADKDDNWLQLQVGSAKRNLEMPEPCQSIIPLKTDVCLIVNWNDWENRYLLLLYQGTDGSKYCLCPSKGFAPSWEFSENKMYLPQRDAIKQSMKFQDVGKEHFLGILMEKPLDLRWLCPNPYEPVPSLDANRFNELWEKLEQQGNWQMLNKYFDVV